MEMHLPLVLVRKANTFIALKWHDSPGCLSDGIILKQRGTCRHRDEQATGQIARHIVASIIGTKRFRETPYISSVLMMPYDTRATGHPLPLRIGAPLQPLKYGCPG